MVGEHVLDALGGEVLALPDDDVLPPSGDAEEAGVVHDREVAGAEEPVLGEGRVEPRIEVADAELWPVGLDLPLDAGPDRPPPLVDQPRDRARDRPAIGAEELLLGIARGTAREHRALRHAVRAMHGTPELLLRLAHQLGRHVGRAGAARPDAPHLGRREIPRREHPLDDGGRTPGAGHAVALDEVDRQLRVEALHEDDARPVRDRQHHEHHDPAQVRERELEQAHVVGRRVEELGVEADHGAERRRGVDHALGFGGRARGVEKHRDVVGTGGSRWYG